MACFGRRHARTAFLLLTVSTGRGFATAGGPSAVKRLAAIVLSRHGARTPTNLSFYPVGDYPWKDILAPGALTSLGKAQMRVMGHRYQYIFEDLAHQKVEVFSSSKERARLSAEAFVEGFFDGEEAAAAAVQVKDGLLRPDSPELKKLLIEKERTPEYERKARGDFAHLMDAFRLTEIGQLRELGDVIISNKVHDLPLPFTDRADELAKEVLSAREWIMQTRYQGLDIGRLGAGRLLRWLVATLTAVPKGLIFLSGHDIDIYSLQSILAVNRNNVFIPDFADAVGLELWVSWSDSGAPELVDRV
ncbi:mitochondrial acyl carrier protein [Perkinsus olseni]|uniref:Mitochondrial acyl carrier protein n=1 Tax=Perkinsus olseni TaxID=32597 RepID=A0A7J6PL68_PEROL|nr:mitochondrial acyl carrier protein [Perkinsus olseni]